jgi:L,D-transpeptidase ErfK/SrfK
MNCLIVRYCSRLITLIAAAMVAACSSVQPSIPVAPVPEVPFAPAPPVLVRTQASDRFVLSTGDSVVGRVVVVAANAEDTLPDIARRFNVGYEEIVRANPGVDPWLPGRGREIVVPTAFVLPNAPQEGVVVNIAAMRLYYYPIVPKGAPKVVITHPIGIGKVGWKTPEGVTRIVARQKDPVWIPPDSVRREHADNGDPLPATVAAGPDNPLGAHLFRLGWPTYLIHGTNKPYGVGMRSSHGCLRLYPEDIKVLFDLIPIGTKVQIVNQPTVLGWRGGIAYVQSFGHLEDDQKAASRPVPSAAAMQDTFKARFDARGVALSWSQIARESVAASGLPLPVSAGRDASLWASIAAAPRVANALPTGATWDGRGGSLDDERQYAEMLHEQEPGTNSH